MEFGLAQEENKFFFYDLEEFLKKKKNTILVNLSPLSGYAFLSASVQDDDNQRLPHTFLDSDFTSNGADNDIEISKK